jgi:hypothetical protein
MGDTFAPFGRGGVYAVEGVFGDGRAPAPDCRLQTRETAFGARKIRELLVRRLDQDVRIPAKSTVHAVLHRHRLVKGIGRPRHRATGTEFSAGVAPNGLWCADFKGEFKLGNGQY